MQPSGTDFNCPSRAKLANKKVEHSTIKVPELECWGRAQRAHIFAQIPWGCNLS